MTLPTPITSANRYTIPGLEGVWQMRGLETTNMGSNGKATMHFVRVEPEPKPVPPPSSP